MSLSLKALVLYFFRLGTVGFGGPIALVAYMKADLVERYRWFSKEEYEEGFAFSQAAPGPIAPQLAMYLAYLRFGVLGATSVVAAFLFTPFVLVLILSFLYVEYGTLGWIQSILLGMSPAVVAIVIHATWQLSRGMLLQPNTWFIATASFALSTFFNFELSILIIGSGFIGLLVTGVQRHRSSLGTMLLSPGALLLPTLQPMVGTDAPAVSNLALFFLKAGALTFGSGYVVVAFLQQGVVEQYHWLTVREFLDGVAIGQITPGPVVITAAFVGYLTEGFAGAVVSLVCVILPIYLITIFGSPLLQKFRGNAYVKGFIASANAAALGTIASVAVAMVLSAVSGWFAAVILLSGLLVLFRWNVPSAVLIFLAGVFGLLVL